ncbi:MAG TPA: NADP-dependent oxidoreductase [Myxococcales bacterium]|nr:NADP-dependent oxidoreductase [Deltaproteobacteria bacterium]MBU47980.1 NADP-dependent oxidoreductase [Deltaproteobacteria bacterium]HAA54327.1 NADP-dependent oxidoreductase [Myxococcales bacterium]|tara:strand:- start:1354 stop:2355 length:1002 start_codon:yes stop_codon:yes gene_type:complete
MPQSKEIHLASRPTGRPTKDNFTLVEVDVPSPSEGQLLIKNHYMSVDPYMRGRMRDAKSYIPPFQVGQVLEGGAVGEVIESNLEGFDVGDFVFNMQGWREYFLSDGKGLRKVDPSIAPLSAHLGVLGMPGITAYAGLFEVGELKEGEQVFVSGAAGAVGSLVGQFAKLKGCYVAGSAGSEKKITFLKETLGFDAAFNYKEGNLHEQIKKVCPKGIDVYFENVGGPMLEAVLLQMNNFGRIPVCGMISQYNATEPTPGPSTIAALIPKRIKMQGFISFDHHHLMKDFTRDVGGWLKDGKLHVEETIVEGIEQAADAFLGLFDGTNTGKMIVKLV